MYMYHQIVEQYWSRRFVRPDLDANYLQRLSADDIGRGYFFSVCVWNVRLVRQYLYGHFSYNEKKKLIVSGFTLPLAIEAIGY